MICAIVAEGLLAFSQLIVLVLRKTDLGANPRYTTVVSDGYIAMLEDITDSQAAIIIYLVIIIVLLLSLATLSHITLSRLIWSFSYDRGMLGWQFFRRVRYHIAHQSTA